ncbi:MAG: transglycosylase domain-containing protein [Maritimibacter sp.]|nr:transglycosylase domain-containing protein [Maritimibacter sp.]
MSPITSALARNALARSAPGLSAGEARLAAAFIDVRLDLSLDHSAILDLYLARAYYGAGCYGVETASLALFAVPLAKADDAQLLALAALPVFPSRTLRDPEARAARIDRILGTLVAEERLTPAEAERLAALAPAEIAKGSFCE